MTGPLDNLPTGPVVYHDVVFATQLQPGDKVLLTMADQPTFDTQHMLQKLGERHPGVEFTVAFGITGIAVQREDT